MKKLFIIKIDFEKINRKMDSIVILRTPPINKLMKKVKAPILYKLNKKGKMPIK